ncbi:exonuclease mut-7 homolog [Contarinia nasturtii]|uniref:exonuclease mut-7 homolog n=1 Tax=Contarinia nasturtii TaxID=265458 RepID=UPI0012D43A86|nr:exonuclease mut-7 homolog [Contarinia nasturtii]
MSRQKKLIPQRCPAGMESDDDSDEYTYFGSSMQNNIKKTTENLKMKIVPDITQNAALNGSSFDASLTSDAAQWLQRLRETWLAYKKGVITSNLLKQFFLSRANPFVDALKLYANCQNANTVKSNTLAYIVIEEFHRFKHENQLVGAPFLNPNLKMVAFSFGRQSNHPTFFKMMASIFELSREKDMFVDKIREIIAEHNYKDACQFAHDLELHDAFTIFDFVFPLVLQDKINSAEPFLEQAKSLQIPLVELLDSLLDRHSSIMNCADPYIAKYGYRDLCVYRLQPKTLSKLIKRLVKQYNISDDAIPNVAKGTIRGQLQFLIRKNYGEKSLSKDSWREMVLQIVQKTAELNLKLELIDGCLFNNDMNEAAYWAKYFNVPISELPLVVQEHIKENRDSVQRKSCNKKCDQNDNKRNSPKRNENRSDPNRYYQLKLSPSANFISYVDRRGSFDEMLGYLSRQPLVAFDAEWNPIKTTFNELALIQCATTDRIFLIDVTSSDITIDCWNKLATNIFNNLEILKLAFSPLADLKLFQRLMPAFSVSVQMMQSYLDLQALWQKLIQTPNFKFPYEDDEKLETGGALSNLVQLCFGKPLDKSNQFSNWNNRPLREEQIIYAALDAFVLIEVYDVIRAQYMSMKNLDDFDEFVHSFLIENKNKISVNKRNQQGAGNGAIPTKSQMRSNNKNHEPPKNRPHYRSHRDDDASKQSFYPKPSN